MTRLPSPRGRVGFKETLTLGLAIAAVVVCLGGGALVLATQIEDVAAQTVIREIGAVLLAIGFLELLHQLFLNRSLANEIFGAVRLASTITETGLEDIGRAPVGWEEFLTEGKVFYLLPPDPVPWLRNEWPRVLDAARTRKVEIRLFIPAWDGPDVATVAKRLGQKPDVLMEELKTTAVAVAGTFEDLAIERVGSSLEVMRFDGVPSYGLAVGEKRWIVLLPETSGQSTGTHIVSVSFREGRDPFIREWCKEQIAKLDNPRPVKP